MRCGNCGKDAGSVAEVKACYAETGKLSVRKLYDQPWDGLDADPLGDMDRVSKAGYEREEAVAPWYEPATPAPARTEIAEDTLYELDGTIYLTVRSERTGYLYAKTPCQTGGFDFAPGAIGLLRRSPATAKLTPETAAAFGKLTNYCAVCGRKLTNTDPGCSVERGYGPVCAEKLGWPWG